ncbi:MAG: hypothetical protein COA79_22080 [Planctomycetota bacterium]|nr:MAG: hypothetical protein COA79_22080 [Planctomycetota bacterium]
MKKIIFGVLLLFIATLIFLIFVSPHKRFFRNTVINPIPASVKNINSKFGRDYRYFEFNVSKEDLMLICKKIKLIDPELPDSNKLFPMPTNIDKDVVDYFMKLPFFGNGSSSYVSPTYHVKYDSHEKKGYLIIIDH